MVQKTIMKVCNHKALEHPDGQSPYMRINYIHNNSTDLKEFLGSAS